MDNPQLTQSQLKQTAKNNLKIQFGMSKNVSHIGIIAIEDNSIRDFIIKGLSDIGVGAVVLDSKNELVDNEIDNISSIRKLNPNSTIGFDFFVYDNNFEGVDVVRLMQDGIVPIMPENNTYSGILNSFDPMKFEGNGFFWKKDSPYCIFEKIISYLENIKFPEDRRTLIKNVMKTF